MRPPETTLIRSVFVNNVFEVTLEFLNLFSIVQPIPVSTLGAIERSLSLLPIIPTCATEGLDVKVCLDVRQATDIESCTAPVAFVGEIGATDNSFSTEGLVLLLQPVFSHLLDAAKLFFDL
jgi:hypothetical protein